MSHQRPIEEEIPLCLFHHPHPLNTLRRIFGTTSLQIRLLVWLALVNNLRKQLSLLL